MRSENWAAAIADFNASNEIVRKHAQCFGNPGICYANLGNRQAALDTLEKAIESVII